MLNMYDNRLIVIVRHLWLDTKATWSSDSEPHLHTSVNILWLGSRYSADKEALMVVDAAECVAGSAESREMKPLEMLKLFWDR